MTLTDIAAPSCGNSEEFGFNLVVCSLHLAGIDNLLGKFARHRAGLDLSLCAAGYKDYMRRFEQITTGIQPDERYVGAPVARSS